MHTPTSALENGERVVAVDIGGTFLRSGSAKLSLRQVWSGATESSDVLRQGDAFDALLGIIETEIRRLDQPAVGIVVGVPGFMDEHQRVVVNTPNMKPLCGMPLADLLERACGLPVWLEHDAALLTRGEHVRGSAINSDSILGVFFGTGIGAAFLSGGEPVPDGAFRMQLGHIPVRGAGRQCSCGAIDCIEPYASGLALKELADCHATPVQQFFSAARENARLAEAADAFIADQAVAVATAITLLDPDVAVIGGGVLAMRDYPTDALHAEIRRRLSPARAGSGLRILEATLGPQAMLYGAASLVARRRRVEQPSQSSHAVA